MLFLFKFDKTTAEINMIDESCEHDSVGSSMNSLSLRKLNLIWKANHRNLNDDTMQLAMELTEKHSVNHSYGEH